MAAVTRGGSERASGRAQALRGAERLRRPSGAARSATAARPPPLARLLAGLPARAPREGGNTRGRGMEAAGAKTDPALTAHAPSTRRGRSHAQNALLAVTHSPNGGVLPPSGAACACAPLRPAARALFPPKEGEARELRSSRGQDGGRGAP